ncbi:MAG TPA: membrane protein insertase YidC [Lentimicrobium sp.]|nr:membrane protein insertase YidC [Lentimicrobium sp.]
MNKNTIIGIVIIFALMIGYTIMVSPSKEELAARKKTQDSLLMVQQQKVLDSINKSNTAISADTTASTSAAETTLSGGSETAVTDSAALRTQQYELFGEFAPAATGTDEEYTIESDLLKITLVNKGARVASVQLKKYSTFDGQPLILFNKDSSDFNIAFFAGVRSINTRDLYFKPYWPKGTKQGQKQLSVEGADSISFAFRAYPGSDSVTANSYIEFLYTVKGNNYMVDYKVNFVNMGGIIKSNTKDINIDWMARLINQEKNIKNERNTTTVYYRHADEEVDNLSERKNAEENISTPVKWVSYSQQFFSSTFIAGDYFQDISIVKTIEPETEQKYLQMMVSTISMPFKSPDNQTFDFAFYYGPNKYNILRKYKMDLEKQIPLGWSFFLMQWINRYAVIPVFNFLEGFNLNYGIIILILTILLKIILFPIAYKTYVSSAKMRLLKPEIDEINAKFTKSDDALKKQQATMALYKKAGVNPMAGCVPMLLQLPILIAMFRFFPASIELRQEPFLWAKDLSSYDSVLDLPFNIPFYGDHVSLFTLLMTISTIIYTKINNDMMATGNQMPGMKTMMYLMPVMFLGFFNSYSAGLSYYYLLANLITFAQMFAIRRFVDEKKLHAQIQENKKKPVKKSGFQKRLEEMAKQQQQRRK